MTLKPLLASLALAASSLASHAATYDLGVIPLSPATPAFGVAVVGPSSTPFTDWWSFSLPSNAALTSFASTSIILDGWSDILGLTLGVYSSIGSTTPLFTGDTHLSNVALDPSASYYLKVTGQTTGRNGGAYSVIASAAPVPEPETWAMLGLGLGVLGWTARRRKKADADEATAEKGDARAPALAGAA